MSEATFIADRARLRRALVLEKLGAQRGEAGLEEGGSGAQGRARAARPAPAAPRFGISPFTGARVPRPGPLRDLRGLFRDEEAGPPVTVPRPQRPRFQLQSAGAVASPLSPSAAPPAQPRRPRDTAHMLLMQVRI